MIMWLVVLPLLGLAIYCLAGALYLFWLLAAALSWRFLVPSKPEVLPKPRLVVAIPAHNEEKLVGRTIESILQCEYPPHLREVVVIADNCSDATAHVARLHGAQALERNESSLRGKGYALDFFIERHLPLTDAEAVVFVDADTIVSRNFLLTVSRCIEEGINVGQVRYTVENARDGWRPAMQFISFALKDHVRALGRQALGCSGGLFGNGMFFLREILLQRGWPATSIVEDVEFAAGLVSDGIRIAYAPDAFVTSGMPVSNSAHLVQKARWETGQWRMAIDYGAPLLRRAFIKRSLDALLWGVELLIPPLMVLGIVACLLLLTSLAGLALTSNPLMLMPAIVSGAAVSLLFIYAGGGLLYSGAPWCVWRSLWMLPGYALWKVWLYLKLAIQGAPKEWVRTER